MKEGKINVSKSKWQGVKNFFGKTDPSLKTLVTNASNALQNLSNEAKVSYNELKLDKGIIKRNALGVWKTLSVALNAVKKLSGTTRENSKGGTGREFANYVFSKSKNDFVAENLDGIEKFDKFGQDVELLQLIANRTTSTSSIPSWIHSAASNTTRFFAYARAYFCIVEESNEALKLLSDVNLDGLQEDLDSFAKKMQSDIESIKKWENIKTKMYDNTLGKIKNWWTKDKH